MREIVLGTAGHVDHGKTSFVRALTGHETDRLKEEKTRGITIELGFAWLDLPCGHRLGIVDVPGHERFVKTMVAGVSGIDLVAFIIAADEGIMPQTVEHLDICRFMGVEQGVVVVTKKDMVEPDWLEMVNEEVVTFCAGSFLEGAPVINVSATTGEGIEEVRKEIDRMVRGFEFREVFGPFRLPVDRCFAMKGFGTVVTGTSISGRLKVGDDVRVFPTKKRARVRGIQVHGNSCEEVEAGHRSAVNLQGVDVGEMSRGMVVASAEGLEPSYMLDVRLQYLSSAVKVLKHRERVRVNIGSAEVMARVSLLDCDELQPGGEVFAQLLCEEQVAVWPGDRFVIRSCSPVLTVGGGKVLGNVPPRKRKRVQLQDRKQNCAALATLEQGETTEKILLLLAESRERGLTAAEIGIRLGLFGKNLKKALQLPVSTKKAAVVDSVTQRCIIVEIAEQIKEMMIARLKEWHRQHPLVPGIVREELRTGLPRPVEVRVFNYCLGLPHGFCSGVCRHRRSKRPWSTLKSTRQNWSER